MATEQDYIQQVASADPTVTAAVQQALGSNSNSGLNNPGDVAKLATGISAAAQQFAANISQNALPIPKTAGSKYVFAFRGTQISFSTPIETWLDLIQADVLKMGLKRVPAQFLEAILFVQEQTEAVSDLATETSRSKAHFPQKMGEDLRPDGSNTGVEKRFAA